MNPIPSREIRDFEQRLEASGRDPAAFSVELHPEGHMRVMGPHGVAFYPPADWLERFSRHLDRGFFDQHSPSSTAAGRSPPAISPG